MDVDKNIFFQKLTLKICSSLEIEKALFKTFKYIRQYIPADGLTFDIAEPDGSNLSIARVTQKGAEIQDLHIPLSPESMEEERRYNEGRKNNLIDDVMIFNAPDINPISKDFAKILKIEEASNIVLSLDLEDSPVAGIAMYSFSQNAYTAEHSKLHSIVKEPFSIAMSKALKHR